MRIREIPVPFSEEEIERLTEIAAEEGGSLVDYIRVRVFGPSVGDPAAMFARIEGARIQALGKRRNSD